MRKLLRYIMLVGLLPFLAQAQELRLIYPDLDPNGDTDVALTASNDTTFDFIFRSRDQARQIENAGFLHLVCRADTFSAGSVGDRDSLTVSARPLYFDPATDDYEEAVTAADSVSLKSDFDWGTNHTDASVAFTYNLSNDLPPCHGVRIRAYTGSSGQVKLRFMLYVARTDE